MKIKAKTIIVDFEEKFKFGEKDVIELTTVNQAFVCDDNIDLEICVDIIDVKFLGNKIEEGYYSFKRFKEHIKALLGLDLDKLIDEEVKKRMDENKIKAKIRKYLA